MRFLVGVGAGGCFGAELRGVVRVGGSAAGLFGGVSAFLAVFLGGGRGRGLGAGVVVFVDFGRNWSRFDRCFSFV